MERDYANGTPFEDLDAPEDIGARAGERTIARLNPREMESTKTNVVYHPRVSASLLGHQPPFRAAVPGTSFLREQMGQQVMSQAVTIIDDPLLPLGSFSRF